MNQKQIETLATFPTLLAALVKRLERDGVLRAGDYADDIARALQGAETSERLSAGGRDTLNFMLALLRS